MKFYKRFPGDITIKTGDLTLTEFGAYDRLLDHYYAKEQPIDPTRVYTVTRCQTPGDRRSVDRVLAEFWTLTEAGWVQQRADEMIAEAQPRIQAARENGKRGGRPKGSSKKPSGFSTETQTPPNQKASQSQSYSVPIGTGGQAAAGEPPDLFPGDEHQPPPAPRPEPPSDRDRIFAEGVPLLTAADVSEKNARSMLASLANRCGDAAVVAALTDCAVARPVQPVSWLQARLKAPPAGEVAQRQQSNPNRFAGAAAAIFDGATHV